MVVQGDTNTALVGAMSCFYERIPVVHVEAGLRTWDTLSPYPEEFNRRSISLISSLNLAPTPSAKENLLRDGINIDTVRVTGNTAIDSALQILAETPRETEQEIATLGKIRKLVDTYEGRYVLLSCHREETLSSGGIYTVLEAVRRLSEAHSDVAFIFILHPNPRSREPSIDILLGIQNVLLVDSLPYASLLPLLRSALLVVSDSGGFQEEASLLGAPMIVLRWVVIPVKSVAVYCVFLTSAYVSFFVSEKRLSVLRACKRV
jgi:UDP-N-acetylglucosamine 2-epimerase (non-hydrolysing)